jgi:hypothetical protein
VAGDGKRRQPRHAVAHYEARARRLGRPSDARRSVSQVLQRDPGHVQARALGERLDARLRPWHAQVTHTVDWFDDDRDSWLETSATIGRQTRSAP